MVVSDGRHGTVTQTIAIVIDPAEPLDMAVLAQAMVTVTLGTSRDEQTVDEMMLGYLEYFVPVRGINGARSE